MDKITLAVVEASTPLSEAVGLLRRDTRGLVVRSKKRPPLLLTLADLLQAENEALDAGEKLSKITLATITPIHKPIIAPGHVGFAPKVDMFESLVGKGRPVDSERYRDLFAQTDSRYAIHDIDDDTAVVVTASTQFAARLTGAIIVCTCNGNPRHRYERWQISNFPACNKAHSATVTCTTTAESA